MRVKGIASTAAALCLVCTAACHDPPGNGFVVLDFSRQPVQGLGSIQLDVSRIDALYSTPPGPTGKVGSDGGPGLSWVPHLGIQCQELQNDFSQALDGGQSVQLDFTTNFGTPQREGVLSLPAGRIQEIRILVGSGTTLLDGEQRPAFFSEQCSDLTSSMAPSDGNDDSGGDGVGVIRLLSKDPNGIEVQAGGTTVVTAALDSSELLIARHSPPGQGGKPPPGEGIGLSKLFIQPNVPATYQLLPEGGDIIIPNEYFIGYQSGTTADEMAAIDEQYNAVVKVSFPEVPAEWIRTDGSAAADVVLPYYAQQSSVSWALPVYRTELDITPNDPQLGKQAEKAEINAQHGWDTLRGSPEVQVAILDTGIDLTNPDLVGNIALNQHEIPSWVTVDPRNREDPAVITFRDLNDPANANACSTHPANCSPSSGLSCDYDCDGRITPLDLVDGKGDSYGWQDGVDGDGDGLVDDIVGWDFTPCGATTDPNQTQLSPGCGNNLPKDNSGHGTALAGLIGADTNNGIGVAGTAWRVGLVPLKIADPTTTMAGTNPQVWSAVRVAAKRKIPIINLSFDVVGTASSSTPIPSACSDGTRPVGKVPNFSNWLQFEQQSWASTGSEDSLIVTSAPNCPFDFDSSAQAVPGSVFPWPAGLKTLKTDAPAKPPAFPNVLAVGATDVSGTTVIGSSGSSLLDLVAPGQNLFVLLPGSSNGSQDCSSIGGSASGCTGTSFAAAQVAGAAALYLSRHLDLENDPIDMPIKLAAALKGATDPVSGGGSGLLDLAKLSNCANTPWTITPGHQWPDACWRPFSDASPFNRPAPPECVPSDLFGFPVCDDSIYDDQSAAIVLTFDGLTAQPVPIQQLSGSTSDILPVLKDNDDGWPTWYSTPSDPAFTVTCDYLPQGGAPIPACFTSDGSTKEQFNVPTYAVPEGGQVASTSNLEDVHMTVIEPATSLEYDFFQFQGPEPIPAGGGTLQSSNGCALDFVTGTGLGDASCATAAWWASEAGRIRAEEMEAGEIDHAIFVNVECVDGPASNEYPAGANPGFLCLDGGSGEIPLGAHFVYLATDGEIDGFQIPSWQKIILKAMAKYGFYVGDTIGVIPTNPVHYWALQKENGAMYLIAQNALGLAQSDPWLGIAPLGQNDFSTKAPPIDFDHRLRLLKPCAAMGTCIRNFSSSPF